MTLEEAIKHAEEVADRCTINQFCAEEHRQLAEWLKDYKRLLEQEPFMNKPCVAHKVCHEDKDKVLDKIRAEINELPSYVARFNGGDFAIHIDKEKVLKIIDKYKAEREDKK